MTKLTDEQINIHKQTKLWGALKKVFMQTWPTPPKSGQSRQNIFFLVFDYKNAEIISFKMIYNL